MKDALGHGSNAHNAGISALPKNIGYRVEALANGPARTAAGQVKTNVGAVWQRTDSRAKPTRNRTVAEHIAKFARVDNPNNRIRIR